MEYHERTMTNTLTFQSKPSEHEAEKASNSYVMSLVALMAGLPLPIINLIATLAFYIANKKGTYFVRWHCTQAVFSQLSLLFINSVGFWWTISIFITQKDTINNNYISYILVIILFNLIEFIATIYSAIQTRKGIHVRWWFYGDIADLICKP